MVLKAIAEVLREMSRQVTLYGVQHLPNGTGGNIAEGALDHAREMFELASGNGHLTWNDVFREEAWEIMAEADPLRLREELVQCAAVCLSWVRDLDGGAE